MVRGSRAQLAQVAPPLEVPVHARGAVLADGGGPEISMADHVLDRLAIDLVRGDRVGLLPDHIRLDQLRLLRAGEGLAPVQFPFDLLQLLLGLDLPELAALSLGGIGAYSKANSHPLLKSSLHITTHRILLLGSKYSAARHGLSGAAAVFYELATMASKKRKAAAATRGEEEEQQGWYSPQPVLRHR